MQKNRELILRGHKRILKESVKTTLRENEKQTDIYWLAWECLRRANVVVPLFGLEFIDSLDTVEVLDEEKK